MKIFVPIKGESQRLPDKNFRIFGGVPLYKYVLDKFRGMDVYVDTDVPDRVENVEAAVLGRHVGLRGNDVSVNRLIGHFLREVVTDDREPIVQVHVTSPFIDPGTILRAIKTGDGRNEYPPVYGESDSIVSCTAFQSRFWRRDTMFNWLPVNHDPRQLKQTQELEALFTEDSLFYVFTKQSFERYDNRVGDCPMFWKTDFPENLDIDTQADWDMAEALLKAGVAK